MGSVFANVIKKFLPSNPLPLQDPEEQKASNMDIDRPSFAARLPTILRDISNASFIAVDLELSGIPVNRFRDVKQSLQERYSEVKQAAEKFHILQVGLTCVESTEDGDGNEKYILRPYNFNLSPLIYEGLEIERSFTYSSGAVDFLLKHNYNMNSPFDAGLPYLSKAETVLAKERAIQRWDKAAIPDIKIRPDDAQALEFIARVHQEVDKWERTNKVSPALNDPLPNRADFDSRRRTTTMFAVFQDLQMRIRMLGIPCQDSRKDWCIKSSAQTIHNSRQTAGQSSFKSNAGTRKHKRRKTKPYNNVCRKLYLDKSDSVGLRRRLQEAIFLASNQVYWRAI